MLNEINLHHLKQNWVLESIFSRFRFGFMEVWVAHGVGNEQAFLVEFKTRINDIFMQEWHSRFEASTRARFYNTFAQFRYQNYLDSILVDIEKFRTSLSKL